MEAIRYDLAMRFPFPSLLATLSLLFSITTFAQNWEDQGFTLLESTTLGPQELYGKIPEAPYELPALNLVILDQSGWSLAKARELATETAQIYLQCALRIKEVRLHLVRAPQGRTVWQKFSSTGESSVATLRAQTPIRSGLVAYFIELLINDEGKPLETTGFSNAQWRNVSDFRPELKNSLFLTQLALSEKYERDRTNSPYNILAHEMLHILSRFGSHYNLPDRNLLNIWRNRTNRILPQHCDWVRESELIASPGPGSEG